MVKEGRHMAFNGNICNLAIMAKKIKQAVPPPKKLNLPNDEPVKLNMSFEEAIKKALNTPLPNCKLKKK